MKDTRLKITHLVENLERGGLERVVIDLASAQQAAGHDCAVVCLFEPGALAAELQARGIEVSACSKRSGLDVAALRRLRGLLRARAGGVLHTHNAAAHYHGVLASIGVPLACVVNTRHGMGMPDPRSRRERLYRASMRRTDAVVAVCEAARDHLQAHGLAPRAGVAVTPNGIRVERFTPRSTVARDALAHALGFAPGTRLLGTVGRLNPVKNQAGLIRAFERLGAYVPSECVDQTGLVIVGDGGLRAQLESLAEARGVAARVRFLGDRSDVDRLLPGLDAFVLPSLSEGHSIALLEACAAALPIVATDVGGNREIVRDGVNGMLVAADDERALAAALARLLVDPGSADAMGRAGRDWALREGSLQAMVARYQRVYDGAMGAVPRGGVLDRVLSAL